MGFTVARHCCQQERQCGGVLGSLIKDSESGFYYFAYYSIVSECKITLTVVQGPMHELSESVGIHWYFLVYFLVLSVPSRASLQGRHQGRHCPVSSEARFYLDPPPYRCFICVSSKVSLPPDLEL
jgi:hypothetical protein